MSEVAKFVLPFSILSENRTEPFLEEMEKAAMFCLAELERSKGGGLILKKSEERLSFLAEFCYPFWLIPWNELTLIFDGLKTTAHTLAYKSIPEVRTFIEAVQRSSKAQETYLTFLSDNVNYFQTLGKEKTMTLDALLTEPNFLDEFYPTFPTAKQVEASVSEMVFLSPTIDEPTILSMTQELENLRAAFTNDTDVLYESMKTVNKTTSNFVKIARGKIKAVKAEFSGEIKKQESLILPKVNRIDEEYDQQTTQLTKTYQKQLLPLQKEKVKFEKNKEQIVNKIERCRIEAKTRAASKDAAGEKRWKEKAGESKKELSETESKIKEVDRKIKEIEESNSLESFRLRSEWEAKVKEAKKDLLDLEASRDAKIQIHQQEIEKLESLTATIIQQIDSMAKLRETSIAAFEKLGFKQKRTTSALIYLPFYLACYQAESKRRYVVFTPSMVNNVGLSAKIKGVLGGTKLKQLLVPRFKSITSLLHKIPLLIEQNAVLGRETEEAGDKADITRASSLRESIRNGAMKLKEEGWLSEKEHENLVQKLT